MSGRKASEVNALLHNGEKTRSASMNVLENLCKEAQREAEKCAKRAKEVESKIAKTSFEISEECIKEFPEAAKKLQSEIQAFKNDMSIQNVKYENGDYDALMKKYQEVDWKADKIREEIQEKIKNQPYRDAWYCDSEYSAARNVQQEYNELSREVQALGGKNAKVSMQAKACTAALEKRINMCDELQQAVSDLEDKAKQIIELRQQASAARDAINKQFQEIDEKIAVKFLKTKYDALKKEVKQAVSSDDNELINQCNEVIGSISEFNNELSVVYGQYLQKKSELETALEALQNRVTRGVYSNPLDEFRDPEEDKYSLLEFLKKYGDEGEYVTEIEAALKAIEADISQDAFEKAQAEIDKLENVITEASGVAATVHENKMKTINNMLTIQDVMMDLNYDVMVTENSNSKDGYCIECTAGDECITFDRVTVVDDGKAIIDIDHKESTKGTCKASWVQIREKLSEEGLFLEDIKKNGKTIFESQAKAANSSVPSEGVRSNQ